VRILSEANVWASIGLLLLFLILGPTAFMLGIMISGAGDYLWNFIPMGFWINTDPENQWQSWWTIFYWGWWIAWCPFVGLFIARVSKGRTIRQFCFCVLLVPTSAVMIWMGNFARAVREAGQLDNHVDRRDDLFPDGPLRQVHAGHHNHNLESAYQVAGAVGMDSGQRAVMAGVHGLEHVQGLAAAALTDDNSVRSHPQAVANQIAYRHLPCSLHIRRTTFETYHVRLAEPQLGGILDGDYPFVVRDEVRQHVEEGGFAAAGAARDDDVLAVVHGGIEKAHHFRVHRAESHQVVGGQLFAREFADGQAGAFDRQRRDHGVDP
jgi:hypothetical protein